MLSIRVSSWGLSVHGGGRVLVRGASYVCDGAVERWLGRRAPRSEEAIHRSSQMCRIEVDVFLRGWVRGRSRIVHRQS
jgi:hypothetical protein